MIQTVFISLRFFLTMSLIVGVIYPSIVTLIGQTFWNTEANGSLLSYEQKIIGSKLLAQKTTSPRLFWARPSASDYGAVPSGASNLGPTSKALLEAIQDRTKQGLQGEMLFASGSGLDPHLSPESARSQIPRIALARKLSDNETREVEALLDRLIEGRDLGILGQPRVNVLKLNLNLIEKFGR